MGKLVLLRHGQSTWNMENRFTGWTDVPLSEQGVQEARDAGNKLKNYIFDKAYTSELLRAHQTLDIVLDVINQKALPVIKDQAINERHYGDLQGLNKAATAEKYGKDQVQKWRRSFDEVPPGGESLRDTANRTIPYFEKNILAAVISGQTILVSAHGNSLRAIVMKLDNLSEEAVVKLEIPTGVPIVYEINNQGQILSKVIL